MRRDTSDFRSEFTPGKPTPAEMALSAVLKSTANRFDTFDRCAFEIAIGLDVEGFEIVRKNTTGRVVVLDEAGERKLHDLISGKSVPTGRIIEVTTRMPDGSTRTQRHAEFGSLDKVSYDPPPVVGSEIAGATVLKATETVRRAAPAKTTQMSDLVH